MMTKKKMEQQYNRFYKKKKIEKGDEQKLMIIIWKLELLESKAEITLIDESDELKTRS